MPDERGNDMQKYAVKKPACYVIGNHIAGWFFTQI